MKPALMLSIMISAVAFGYGTSALANEAAATKAGCMACHGKDKKILGPAFRDIAAKYKGEGDAAAKLAEKVRKGGSGIWGPIPMSPNGPDKISDEDLKSTVDWILKGAL